MNFVKIVYIPNCVRLAELYSFSRFVVDEHEFFSNLVFMTFWVTIGDF